jgi:hypothetical protein
VVITTQWLLLATRWALSYLCFYHKTTWHWVIYKEEKFIFSQFWRPGSSKSRFWLVQLSCSQDSDSLLHPLKRRNCVFMGKRMKGQVNQRLWSLFIKALISFTREESPGPHPLLKTPPFGAITLPTSELWMAHTQTTAILYFSDTKQLKATFSTLEPQSCDLNPSF